MNALYSNLLKKLFKGHLIDIDEATLLDNVKTYMQGVFQGYGGDFSTFAYDTPDYNKLAHIEANVYQFSGAKNYHQLRDLTSALKDGDRILPFREFRTKAISILDEYQGSWLRTEYNAAIAGSQMASKWVGFQNNPDAILQYRTMEDDRVREEHAVLNGIARPVTDSFWKTYYPPNGWNCRCTVIENNDARTTPAKEMEYPDIPAMFQTNLGKAGLVFPKNSPLFIGIPKSVTEKINALIPNRKKP
jgi:SPP1 gp7 family putative phage head morphogenesis protein